MTPKFRIHSNDDENQRQDTAEWARQMNISLSALDKLHTLCDDCTCMTDWECNFIDSVSKTVERTNIVTEKQAAVIERIYKNRM